MNDFLSGGRRNRYISTSRGTEGVLLTKFLKAYLPKASYYRRAVGYFSSSIFEVAHDEFVEFFHRGGRFELICCPQLSKEDLNVIHAAFYRKNTDQLRLCRKGPMLLKAAIAEQWLSLKIAIVSARPETAIYHEKIGLLDYEDGSCLAFEGSANESAGGFVSNYERITWYAPGIHKCDQTIWMESDFEDLWNNRTPGLIVSSLHDAFRHRLFVVRPSSTESNGTPSMMERPDLKTPEELLRLPPRLELRPYQNQAIADWLRHRGCGVFAMATGSGKTITALAALEKLYTVAGSPLVIIITAPYLNLVEQWIGECRQFGLEPINCTGASSDWASSVDTALFLVESGDRPILTLVT